LIFRLKYPTASDEILFLPLLTTGRPHHYHHRWYLCLGQISSMQDEKKSLKSALMLNIHHSETEVSHQHAALFSKILPLHLHLPFVLLGSSFGSLTGGGDWQKSLRPHWQRHRQNG
jgi:hypothetical protein